ncbi:transglutaminase domain-containing protein [Dokdonella sp.]|uniref:transglutaminase domain-containing protein n=1 Tax=Dokdonella sp. TaxID=2291710 RepID=UPI003C436D18
MLRLLVTLALALPLLAQAKPAEELWYSVLLDGRKIGSFEFSRTVQDDEVTTRQLLDIEFDRAGTIIAMKSHETSRETIDGQPLAFTSISQLSGNENRVDGRLEDKTLHVRVDNAAGVQERQMPWPKDALLAEGLRLSGLRMPLKLGQEHTDLSFQPSSLAAVKVTSTVGEREPVSLPSGRKSLYRIEQVFDFSGTLVRNSAWIDRERDVYKLTMPALGVDLTLLECSETCATAPNQSSDVFKHTLMQAPRALRREETSTRLRYTIAPVGEGAPLEFPTTSEQSVERNGESLIVEVYRQARSGIGEPPEPADYEANDWLQSDAPEIVAMARGATFGIENNAARMQALETFVRGFITDKTLGVGYASALQIVRKPEGDCTEHAVLLATLGRALGIATRVVDGLAYSDYFASQRNVFVPHAWMQAWVDGRWQSYDAALAGFDAGHIAFSSGDGDPWRFYNGLDLLGRTKLLSVESMDNPTRQ